MLNMGRSGGSFDAIRVTLLDLCKQLTLAVCIFVYFLSSKLTRKLHIFTIAFLHINSDDSSELYGLLRLFGTPFCKLISE